MFAKLVPGKAVYQHLSRTETLLAEQHNLHRGAIERWRMGWLTEDFPEDEARYYVSMGLSAADAAQDIADRIRLYSLARTRADGVLKLLDEKYRITGQTKKDWLLNREDWSLVR